MMAGFAGYKQKVMLRAKVLPKVLEQVLSNGVEVAALLDADGSLLACAGDDGRVVAAIFANIWSSFEDRSSLEYILCELENGRVCMTKVTPSILLVVYGKPEAQLGMLKHKASLLKKYFEEPLNQLNHA
eukprot:TRINITY_DN3172_c0_g2_i1.p1 TRINITY_DN3172_c0_g2~~TRINITY_DN3172_c0_g2_i1.p1  ORF type:complete len:129 (-),score=27.49 TRINITY_DN3172_c0_g2_i1:54-440(-)